MISPMESAWILPAAGFFSESMRRSFRGIPRPSGLQCGSLPPLHPANCIVKYLIFGVHCESVSIPCISKSSNTCCPRWVRPTLPWTGYPP